MKAGKLRTARPAARANHAVVLFWVGPHRLGIPAGELKEIRNGRGVTLEEVGCTTISANKMFGVAGVGGTRLLVLRSGRVAVRVDLVERMIETSVVHPLPQAFQSSEREWFTGIGLAGDMVFPLVRPEALENEARRLSQGVSDSGWAPPAWLDEVIAQ